MGSVTLASGNTVLPRFPCRQRAIYGEFLGHGTKDFVLRASKNPPILKHQRLIPDRMITGLCSGFFFHLPRQ